MSNSYEKGKETFDAGLYCAESVLKVITDEEGIKSSLLPGIATGFCSGMARTCNMCGALTGGVLALNVVYGRSSSKESLDKNYDAVQTLISNFEKEFGSVNCQELLGCDLGTDEGKTKFQEKELHTRCREYTGKSTELVRSIIDKSVV